ncbi:substrate-binding periplasmic protein [Undibacterium sp. Dicai25W]|uniref:substrate-binding periplasmic protein n=1 Tax=Undibacterium sp. Dicai25W TaxID=3413034 RepID=UPI003BF1A979
MSVNMLLILFFLNCSLAHADQLLIYIEDTQPYAYAKNSNTPTPIADFVKTIAIRAGYQPEIRPLSWIGIMHLVNGSQPVIFFPVARTPFREDKYIWLGGLAHVRGYYLYKKKDRIDIQINKLEDAKEYRIGVIEDDAREQFLKSKNFKASNNGGLINISDNNEGIRLLSVGRLDLLPLSQDNFDHNCATFCQDFVTTINLGLELDLQLGANKATSKDVVDRLRNAYTSLQKDGTRQRMLGNN